MMLFLFLTAFLPSCGTPPVLACRSDTGQTKTIATQEKKETPSSEGQACATIPLKHLKSKFLAVEVMIENRPFLLILDTGTPITHLDPNRTKDVSLKWIKRKDEPKSKKESTSFAHISQLAIGQFGGSFWVGAFDLAEVNRGLRAWSDPEIDGLLGGDFFARFRAVIDYGKMTLLLFEEKTKEKK